MSSVRGVLGGATLAPHSLAGVSAAVSPTAFREQQVWSTEGRLSWQLAHHVVHRVAGDQR
jgi:hypothetical protein